MLFRNTRFAQSVTYTGGTTPANYKEQVVERMNAIAKIAYQIIRGVQGQDKLDVFNKTPVDKGLTIEQMVVKLAESQAFDPEATDVFKPNFNAPVVRYFRDWSEKQFSTSVSRNDIRKVLEKSTDENTVAELLVAALAQGDIDEKFQDAKALFTYGATENLFTKVGEDIDVTATNGYKTLLKAIKNTVKAFTYVSDKYNKAEGGLRTRSMVDNIRIIAPYDIITDLDVDELSGVFNLDKAEIREKIIETDATDGNIYIVDINAILICTRLYMMTDQLNPKALYHNYWLTVDRMFAISPLFNSAYIHYTRGE